MKGGYLKRTAITIFIIGFIAVTADIIQHYIISRLAENWLQTSSRRQNSFILKLNVFPLGGANVEINNLVSVGNSEKFTANKVTLRKRLFDFKTVTLTAKQLTLGNISADTLQGKAQKATNATGAALVFKGLELDNLSFNKPPFTLKTQRINGDALYRFNDKVISFALNSPKVFLNDKETIGLDLKGDLTIFTPRDGELIFKVKDIDELGNTLVEAGYLKPNQAQILIFGGQLLGDNDGQVRVKLKFRKGDVYWGPIKLKL